MTRMIRRSLLTRTGRHFWIFSGSLSSCPFSEKMLVVLGLMSAQSLHTRPMMSEQGPELLRLGSCSQYWVPHQHRAAAGRRHYTHTHIIF